MQSSTESSANATRSRLGGCLAVVLIAAALCFLGAGWFFFYGKNYFADSARDTLVKVIEESAISAEEQAEMIAQIDRLTDGFKGGEVGYGAMAQIFTELAASPVMAVLAVVALETNYVLPSGLTGEEKAEAHITMERVARGLVEDLISEEDLDPVLDVVTKDPEAEEGRILKERLSDDELREFLARAKRLADDAGVPDEPLEVNLAKALRDAVDRALQAPPPAE